MKHGKNGTSEAVVEAEARGDTNLASIAVTH